MHTHEYYMQIAIDYAKQHNPVWPFAAILVDQSNGEIITQAVNQAHLSPTQHGEIVAIEQYCKTHHKAANGLVDLSHLILYTTGEPCPMCQSAIYWANIKTIVYGSSINTLNRLWGTQITLYAQDVIDQCPNHYNSETQLIGSVLTTACDELFTQAKRLQ